MSEVSKHRDKFIPYCVGCGLDIGFGGDPVVPWAITFDLPKPYSHVGDKPQHISGDARDLYMFKDNSLDFLFSSHCLEDFENTHSVLLEWLRVVKFGGYLCLLFPDEKVYRAKTRVRNLEHKHEDFGMDFVMQILENINKVKMLTKEYSLTVVKREECFEGDDYNCILVIQKEGAEVKQGLEPMFKTHYLGHFPRVD